MPGLWPRPNGPYKIEHAVMLRDKGVPYGRSSARLAWLASPGIGISRSAQTSKPEGKAREDSAT
ncbi:hypothetical protein Pure05_42310 [Paenarthrobacter ureafaciens]|nr:hypothetical protein Pure01_42330 [Paenarthrobacter ureafaciens]GLU66002.1 hypothetical protein Pure02_42520 [Paenarthrobacter ureafaciens]GLU74535.1 hypothetical protein Pure04_42500 [Paenarthrobacter ureafaciens]GLU78791.1 hypothetical protein Pure05_42310 [Paenarthrobacter ureafaciens]